MAETWLARFDREHATADLILPVIVALRAARNRVDHRDAGAPLLSQAEIRLQLLEERAAARELHRRADAGDQAAILACVRLAAESELLIDDAKAMAAAQERCLLGQCGDVDGDQECHVRPPGSRATATAFGLA